MRRTTLLALTLLLALAAPAAAQHTPDSAIVIRSMDAELAVQPDGVVEVTEVLRFGFTGQWRGILRDLSLRHHTAQGRRQKLDIELTGATDGAGNALRWEEDGSDDSWVRRMRVYIPGARNNERTVVLRYRVRNAVRFYFAGDAAGAERVAADFDELYWNATGNGWDMPIERATARIVLPPGARPSRYAVYTGPDGAVASEADVAVDSARGIVTFTARGPLAAYEGMTVAAAWPAGAIQGRPTKPELRRAAATRLWPLVMPILALLLGMRAWRRRGRDPRAQSVTVGYEPPDGVTPAEAGTLIDHRAETRDVISTLVDLAVRGYVGIEERVERKLLGLLKDTDYVFYQRRPREAWGQLLPHEERFMSALFGAAAESGPAWDAVRAAYREAARAEQAGERMDGGGLAPRLAALDGAGRGAPAVQLSDLRNKFYTSLPGIRDGIYENLIRRGYYRDRPDRVKGKWIGGGIFVLIIGLICAAVAADEGVGWVSGAALAAGTVVSAIVFWIFGAIMPARTESGARAREAALGFREFLSRVESDRYRRMVTSPEMFERFLPYAMAFGVEDRWAAAFDDLYREPPDWYSGGYGNFRASSFSARMSTLSSSAGSTMSSSPSSSGSGGGGSSGGGSGGGGGSGF